MHVQPRKKHTILLYLLLASALTGYTAGCGNVLAFLAGAGAGAGLAVNPPQPEQPGETIQVTFFDTAKIAEQQFATNQIPTVLKQNGDVLILDVPANQDIDTWTAGEVILVRNLDGTLAYKVVVFATRLPDGNVGLVGKDISMLGAISSAEVNITREADFVSKQANPQAQKVVTILDIEYTDTIDLVDFTGRSFFPDPANSDTFRIDMLEGYIRFSPNTRVEISVQTVGPELINIIGQFGLLVGELLVDTAIAGIDGEIDSEDELEIVSDFLDNAQEVQDALEMYKAAAEDPQRIQEAVIEIEGPLRGRFQPSLVLGSEYTKGFELQVLPQDILVQLPVPGLQLTLNAALTGEVAVSGQMTVTTGLEFGGDLHAWADYAQDGGIPHATFTPPAELGGNDYVRRIDPILDASVDFSVKAGVQPQVGLTLTKILGLTVKPEAYAQVVAGVQATATPGQACVRVDWDLFAGIEASITGEALGFESPPLTFFSPNPFHLLGPTVSFQPPGCDTGTLCGNGICEPGETTTSCSSDCLTEPICGDGICEGNENSGNCPSDCPDEPDSDEDGTPDDQDGCPFDPNKTSPGDCGCGNVETPDCPSCVPTSDTETNCSDGIDNDCNGATDGEDTDHCPPNGELDGRDAWDPEDDFFTFSPTVLNLTATVGTHGPHTLGGGSMPLLTFDLSDWFEFQLAVGRTYQFTAGNGELRGELYRFQQVGGEDVAESVTAGTGFSIMYTAESDGLYFLEIRTQALHGEASYTLEYSEVE